MTIRTMIYRLMDRMLTTEREYADDGISYLASLRERWRFLDLDHSARHGWLNRRAGQQRRI
jgi:hypothetical protein